MTSTINIDAKYIDFLIPKDQSVKICLGIGDDPVYEPYTGGQPSPSPDYPQEIKSVVNPTVKVTNEDGLKVQSVTLNNVTLNAIPVSSGGNVTIDGQQYVADYIDFKRGKIVKNILQWNPSKISAAFKNGDVWHINISSLGINGEFIGLSNTFKIQNSNYAHPLENEMYISTDGRSTSVNMRGKTNDEFKQWLNSINCEVLSVLLKPIEVDLTSDKLQVVNELKSYYPVTNVSTTSDSIDGFMIFNYPISMKNGWNYVKKQLNDNRDYIYDIDTKTQDIDTQAAEAYVNSEYAVALTELEV